MKFEQPPRPIEAPRTVEQEQDVDFTDELKEMYEADQGDRTSQLSKSDMGGYLQRENQRAQRAREIYSLYEKGELTLSPMSLGRLAMIFQHRATSEDYKIAHELATKSAEGGVREARWLQAATEDRYLISIGQKQKWGTQFEKTDNGWQYLAPIEDEALSGITDETRQMMGVPVKAEQLQKIAEKYPGR